MQIRILKRWNSIPDAAKSSIAFAVSSFFTRGIVFLTTPVFTRALDTEQYGLVTTYNSWVSILEVFAILGLTSAGVFNVGLNEHKKDRDQYVSSVLFLCNITTICVFIIIFGIKTFSGFFSILPNNLLLAMLIGFLFSPAQIFWLTRQRYEYKYKLAFIVAIVSSIVSQLISLLAIIVLKNNNYELGIVKIWASTLALLLVQIPIYIHLYFKGRVLYNPIIWKATLAFALPLLPHYLAQHLMSSSDRIMISSMYSQTGAAIYGVVSNISMVTTIIWSAINASLIPITFDKIEKHEETGLNLVVVPLLIFYSAMCFIVTLIAPEVLIILAPKEYYSGIYAVPPIAITAFVTALYNIYANIEFYHKKSWWIAFSTIVSASINLILNSIFIPRYGFVAASYTTFVSHILLVFLHYIGYRKYHKCKMYNDKQILAILLITIVLCLMCNLLYSNDILRYALVFIALVVSVIRRKSIIECVKAIRKP